MSSNNLPPNWSWVKLGDVVENFKRGPFGSAIKKSFFVSEGYKVYEQKNAIYNSIELGNYFIDEQKFLELQGFEVGPGDFIVSCSGTIGKIYRLPPNASKGVINQALLRIRHKERKIFEKYFLELFKSYWFQKKMLVETRGSAMLNIAGVKELKQITIPLPPLPEQQKIVEKIEELFSQLESGVASLKKAKEQIRLYRQSVLAFAFSGRLVNESQKSKVKSQMEMLKAAEPKVEYSNQLPEGWKWVKLGEIIKVSSGKGLTSANMFNDGLYSVYGGNGVSGYYNEFLFEEPRLIIGRVGAKCGVIHITKPKSWVTDNALIVDFKSSNVQIKFLYHCLDYHNLNKLSVSTAQPVISGAKIYPYEILLPPLTQQIQIVEEIEKRFSEADNLEKAIDESLTKAETLRQSILKQAFEGKLI
jgi:type I restriction enzyme, S subunit